MKCFGMILIVIFAIIVPGARAQPNPEKFSLNKNHTYIGFDVGYFVVLRVVGRFDDFEGFFVIDRDHPENNRADITIKTNSVNTGSRIQDKDIRGPGLFNADRYPTMVFHSKKIEIGTDNTGYISGDLTLLDTTKPVTLDLVRVPDARTQTIDRNSSYEDGFIITGKIKRSDFGMNALIRPISDTVTLLVCYKMEKCDNDHMSLKRTKPEYNE